MQHSSGSTEDAVIKTISKGMISYDGMHSRNYSNWRLNLEAVLEGLSYEAK